MDNKIANKAFRAALISLLFAMNLAVFQARADALGAKEPYIEYVSRVDEVSLFRLAGLYQEYSDIPGYEFSKSNPVFLAAESFLEKAKGASFDYDGQCSATFISDDGHALTAYHCLMGLMATPNEVNFADTTRSHPMRIRSVVQFGTHADDQTYQQIQLIAWGDFVPFKRMEGAGLEDIKSLVEENDDWAIVKFVNLPKTHSCASSSAELPQSGSKIWYSGFPIKAEPYKYLVTKENVRRDRYAVKIDDESASDLMKKMKEAIYQADSQIRGLFTDENVANDPFLRMQEHQFYNPHVVSVGRFYNSYAEAFEAVRYPFYGSPDAKLESFFEYPKYAFSTLHVAMGMSGGGVYDANSDLIGVLTASAGGPYFGDIYQIGARFVALGHIKSAIKSKHNYSTEEIDKMFKCRSGDQ